MLTEFQWVSCIIHRTYKLFFLNKTFIKNEFHDTIHTFKNYFAIIFSFLVFSFQQNKRYPNGS